MPSLVLPWMAVICPLGSQTLSSHLHFLLESPPTPHTSLHGSEPHPRLQGKPIRASQYPSFHSGWFTLGPQLYQEEPILGLKLGFIQEVLPLKWG